MNRRNWLRHVTKLVVGMLAATPLAALAALRVIGVLSTLPPLPAPEQRALEGVSELLAQYGWVEGRDFAVQRRYAGDDTERLRRYAKELVLRQPDLILCIGTQAVIAAKEATTSIPIVMFMVGDPVATGLVESLSRPGANVTGLSSIFPELYAKRAAMLKELLPSIRRVGVLVHPGNPLFEVQRTQHEAAFRRFGIATIYGEVGSADDIVLAVERLARQHTEALVVLADPLLNMNAVVIVGAATTEHLPVIGSGDEIIDAGGVMSFEPSFREQQIRMNEIVDKILRGAKPADIPVQQPATFELVLNAKSARALGLEIPLSLLVRASRVVR